MTRNLLSAEQVARRLGVQRASVYAYVSRGLLTRTVALDGRSSLFDPDEVEELARRGRPRRRSTRTGSVDVVLASGVTQIEGNHIFYRGHDAALLCARSGFEAVAELLWTGSPPDPLITTWPVDAAALAVAVAATDALPDGAPMAARLAVAAAAVAAADPARGDLRPETVRRQARTMISIFARTPVPLGAIGPPDEARPVAEDLWPRLTSRRPSVKAVRALDAALVLLADHELATSTLAARVAASTRANPFACVLAAIGAVSGPLHGRAAITIHRALLEAHSTGDAASAVTGALDNQGHLPGFGHPLYTGPDPRATALLAQVRALASPRIQTSVDAVAAAAGAVTGAEPNIDFALGALALAGGMVLGATEAIFVVGRTAGWVAHVQEEYDERPLRYRPRAIYTGGPPAQDPVAGP